MLSCSFRTGTTTDNSIALARGLPDTSIHLTRARGGEKCKLSHRREARHRLCCGASGQRTNAWNVLHSNRKERASRCKEMSPNTQQAFENMGFPGRRTESDPAGSGRLIHAMRRCERSKSMRKEEFRQPWEAKS